MGMDFKAAALQVGKALNDPARGLTRLQRIGVVFSDGQRKQIEGFVEQGRVMDAQRIILAELNKEFGGSAKAFGETMPGQLKRAQESFRNLGAELLVTLLPAITQIGERLLAFSGFLRENPKLAKGMVIGLAALSAALLTASAAQIALNLAVLANPYVAAAVAIGALVAALVVLDQRTQVVRKHWQLLLIPFGVFPVLIATVAKAVVRNMDSIASAFKHAYDFARRFIVPIAQFFNPIVGAVQRVISYVHQLTSAIQAIPSPGDIGNAILPGNPFGGGRAAGGPVAAGVPYLVGERGPELFVPRGSGTIVPNSRGGGSGGYPGGPVLILTDAATARWLQGLNSRYSRGNGGRSIW
jgi:hypothetical protein